MKTARPEEGREPRFARWVRERLRERGLGLREFCREADVDPSFLSKVLQGKRSPPWDEGVLRRMARALEVDAPRLIASAGRIPSEWGRVIDDESLYDAVDSLVRGGRGSAPASPSPSAASGERPAPPRTARSSAPMGEELL